MPDEPTPDPAAVRAAALREGAALLVAHASTLEALSSSDSDSEAFAASHLRTKAVDLCRLADEAQQSAPEAAPAGRAAVLEGAARTVENLPLNPAVMALGGAVAEAYRRALNAAARAIREHAAPEATVTEEHRPQRGDAVAQWLRAQREAAVGYPTTYQAVDGLLDLYRLHADTGTPLSEHACEGKVTGDCECLEPASEVTP